MCKLVLNNEDTLIEQSAGRILVLKTNSNVGEDLFPCMKFICTALRMQILAINHDWISVFLFECAS